MARSNSALLKSIKEYALPLGRERNGPARVSPVQQKTPTKAVRGPWFAIGQRPSEPYRTATAKGACTLINRRPIGLCPLPLLRSSPARRAPGVMCTLRTCEPPQEWSGCAPPSIGPAHPWQASPSARPMRSRPACPSIVRLGRCRSAGLRTRSVRTLFLNRVSPLPAEPPGHRTSFQEVGVTGGHAAGLAGEVAMENRPIERCLPRIQIRHPPLTVFQPHLNRLSREAGKPGPATIASPCCSTEDVMIQLDTKGRPLEARPAASADRSGPADSQDDANRRPVNPAETDEMPFFVSPPRAPWPRIFPQL